MAQTTDSMDMAEYNIRLSDIADEPKKLLLPIEGYEEMPLVTLEEAINPISDLLPNIDKKIYVVKHNCEHPKGGLTTEQAATIMLYTIGKSSSDTKPFYYVLNSILRSDQPDRADQLRPWFLYLKLFITALSYIPSYRGTVYRGVKLNLSEYYTVGRKFVWWAFSSCTKSLGILQSELFLGQEGEGTLFVIDCFSGKEIRQYSYYEREDEVLLVAARQFIVVSHLNPKPGLWIIQIKEIEPPFQFLKTDSSISSTFETSNLNDTNQSVPPNICSQCLKNVTVDSTLDAATTTDDLPGKSISRSNIPSNEEIESISTNLKTKDIIPLDVTNFDQLNDEINQSELVEYDSDSSEPFALMNSKPPLLSPKNHQITVITSEQSATMPHLLKSNLDNFNSNVDVEATIRNIQTKIMRFENKLITEATVKTIADDIRQNLALEILYVCNNGLKDRALQYILEAIIDRSSLKLFIRDNKISDIGATYIAKVLSTTPNVIFKLDLDKNRLTNEGLKSILQALSLTPNSGLRILSFSGNLLINDGCIDDVILLLNENRTLRSFYLDKCNLSEDGKNRLQMAFNKRIALAIYL